MWLNPNLKSGWWFDENFCQFISNPHKRIYKNYKNMKWTPKLAFKKKTTPNASSQRTFIYRERAFSYDLKKNSKIKYESTKTIFIRTKETRLVTNNDTL